MSKNLYTHERWKEFQQEVVDLDGNRCSHCGRSRKSHPGTILQVHHKRYVKGREPWDYATSDCETLCKACHAREHGKIPPVEGWRVVSEMDLGGLEGTCERCGTNAVINSPARSTQMTPAKSGTTKRPERETSYTIKSGNCTTVFILASGTGGDCALFQARRQTMSTTGLKLNKY